MPSGLNCISVGKKCIIFFDCNNREIKAKENEESNSSLFSFSLGLYPFGASEGDASVGTFDDAIATVNLDEGMPVGQTRYNQAYIGTNGIISFNYPYNSPLPYAYDNLDYYNNYYSYSQNYYNSYYVTSNFHSNAYYNFHQTNFYNNYYFYPWTTARRPRIVAPFWTDISLRGGRGHVYYHVYKAGCSTNNPTNYIIRRANADVGTFMRRTNFKARMVVVVTWHEVEPYSNSNYYSDQSWWPWWNSRFSQIYSSQRDQVTFQSVLVSDGRESFSLFFYKLGGFAWRYKSGRRILIGSVGVNDRFNTVLHSYRSSALIMDQLRGNTGERSFWAFQLGNRYSSAQACLDWYNCNRQDATMARLARLLPDCPCSLRSRAWDWRWGRPFRRNSGRVCFSLRLQFWLTPLSKECCYINGQFESRRPFAGSAYRYHPLVSRRLHYTLDTVAKDNCCARSSLCHLYYQLRPTGTCAFANPWQQAAMFGDPHILTLDGKSYSYNGWGEYVMLDVDTGNQTFVLQGRTSLAMTENGTTSNATVFVAFAAKDSQNASMHVELNLNKNGMVIYGHGIDLTNSFYASDTFEYETSTLVLSREDQSLVVAFAASGVSLTVSVGINLLTVTVAAPTSWRNLTRGLMGNFNGDPEDDFVARNGSALPGSASEEDIFTYFGNTWETTHDESVFVYQNGKSHSDYQYSDFQPIFLDKVDQATLNSSYDVCGGAENLACVYDFVATGSRRIATASATTLNQTLAAQAELKKVYPSLEPLDETLNVSVSDSVTAQLRGSDPDTAGVTYHLVDDSPDVKLNANSGEFTYTPHSFQQQTLSFYVEDSDGLKSPIVAVDVVLCSGCNGHGTCNYADTSRTDVNTVSNVSNSNTRLAVCDCSIGWTGADCETDLNACQGNPCSQGQNCTDLDPATHQAQAAANPSFSPQELGFNCSACPEGFEVVQGKCQDIDECTRPNTCQQRCENTEGSFRCSCNKGYRVVDGNCIDIDECLEQISDCQQVCTNTPGSFSCSCEGSYLLQPDNKTCALNTSYTAACAALQCEQGCRESTTGGALECFCFLGYGLVNTTKCVNIDECSQTPSPCAQRCQDLTPGFQCSCFPGHILSQVDGSTCLPCGDNQYGENCNQTCECGGSALYCHPVKGCVCSPQWTGPTCTEDVNECEVNPNICNVTDQTCVNTLGSYTCQCPSGYTLNGTACTNVDECSDITQNSCNTHQVCRDTEGSYVCECKPGYAGPNCDDIDECQTLQSGCSQLCDNMEGSFNCRCYAGYVLADDRKTCNPAGGVDPCGGLPSAANCSQGCTVSASNTSLCICRPGFRLANDNVTCNDIDECSEASPCSHTCTNNEGGYNCSCQVGFYLDNDGRNCRECDEAHWGANCQEVCRCGVGGLSCNKTLGCQCRTGFNNTAGAPCEDVDECKSGTHNCGANATCENTPGSFRCLCATGFTLNATSNACEDLDECLTSPCDQTCTNTVGSFLCSCSSGFIVNETHCDDINECAVNNGGCEQDCNNNLGSFSCTCRPGFDVNPNNRSTCTDIDECATSSNNCTLLEDCVNTGGGFNCTCKAGYERDASNVCKDVNECLSSPCQARETCTNTNGNFTCACMAQYRTAASGSCIDTKGYSLQLNLDLPFENATRQRIYDLIKQHYENSMGVNGSVEAIDPLDISRSASGNGTTVNLTLQVNRDLVPRTDAHVARATAAARNQGVQGDSGTVPVSSLQLEGQEVASGATSCQVFEQLSPCNTSTSCDTSDGLPSCEVPPNTKGYSLQFNLDLPFENATRQRIYDLIKQHYENSMGVNGSVEAIDPLVISRSASGNGTTVNLTLQVNRDLVPLTDAHVARATAAARNQGVQGDSGTVPVSSLQLEGQEVASGASSCQVFEQLSPCNTSTSCDNSDGLPSCEPVAQPAQDYLVLSLAVGLSLALLALLAACGIFAWCRSRRRRRREEQASYRRSNIYGSVRQAFGSSIPTRHQGKARLLYEPDALSSAGGTERSARSVARSDFDDSLWAQPERPQRPDTENQPPSNFSWDFLYKAMQPDGEFKIERPQFSVQPNQIFNGRRRFPDSTA